MFGCFGAFLDVFGRFWKGSIGHVLDIFGKLLGRFLDMLMTLFMRFGKLCANIVVENVRTHTHTLKSLQTT